MSETASRQQKHAGFHEAISLLEDEIYKLSLLVDRVRGTEQPQVAKDAPVAPCAPLAEFLASGDERIRHLAQKVKEYRDSLRELLF